MGFNSAFKGLTQSAARYDVTENKNMGRCDRTAQNIAQCGITGTKNLISYGLCCSKPHPTRSVLYS